MVVVIAVGVSMRMLANLAVDPPLANLFFSISCWLECLFVLRKW
jgi:hypothetical protein